MIEKNQFEIPVQAHIKPVDTEAEKSSVVDDPLSGDNYAGKWWAETTSSRTPKNAPITWPQLIGSWLSDAPIFLLAALPLLGTWLQSDTPLTTRGLITVIILGILAGLTAVTRMTGTDSLSLRLRANGQINGGR